MLYFVFKTVLVLFSVKVWLINKLVEHTTWCSISPLVRFRGCVLYCEMFRCRGTIGCFRGLEKDPSEFWFLVRFPVSFWDSVLKLFCNYSLCNIFLDWIPFLPKLLFLD